MKTKEQIDTFVTRVEAALRSHYATQDTALTISRPAAIAAVVDALKWAADEPNRLELFFPELSGEQPAAPVAEKKGESASADGVRSKEQLMEVVDTLTAISVAFSLDQLTATDKAAQERADQMGTNAYVAASAIEWAAGKDNAFEKFFKKTGVRKLPDWLLRSGAKAAGTPETR